MNINCNNQGCPDIIDSSCVFYEGQSLIYTGIVTNDSIELSLQKIDAKIQSVLANSTLQGSGTTNRIAKWAAATNLTDSIITDNGTTVSIAGALNVVGFDSILNTLKIGLGGGQVSTNISIGTTSIGQSSGTNTGDYLLGIGFRALRFNTTGRANVVYGNEGMGSNTVGSYNTALSIQALLRNTTGNNNTAVGVFSNIWNTTGSNNITIGYASGNSINGTFGLISGDYNIFLGVENYAGITTGSYNVIIGNRVVGLSSSTTNNIVIADGQGNIRIQAYSTGNVGINTPSNVDSGYKLDVNGNLRIRQVSEYASNAAAITAGLISGAFYRTGEFLKVVY